MQGIAGKIAVITGAASGMGKEIALTFAQQKARHIALLDINADALEAVCDEVAKQGVEVSSHIADLRDGDEISTRVNNIVSLAGGIDTLINAAGVLDHMFTAPDQVSVDKLDEAAWDAVMDINLKAVWLMTKAASPALLASERGPSIVNFASVAGMHGSGMTAYSVSKAGVIQLTRVAAINLAPNVRVNAISPGSIRTPMSQAHLDAAEDRQQRALNMYGTHLIPRLGEVREIVDAVTFLASDAASFITGINMPVDGGTTSWRGMQTSVEVE